MSNDLLNAARAEEQRLLRQLQETPLFRRLEAVRALLSTYEEENQTAFLGQAPTSTASSRTTRRTGTPREGSLTAQVVKIAEDYLQQQQRRAQSQEILSVLQTHGVDVKGDKPTTIVASILSHSDRFDNVRGKGYGLSAWSAADQTERPEGADEGDLAEISDSDDDRPDSLDSRADLVSNGNWATTA